MNALDIDFERRRRPVSMLGLLLLVVGGAALLAAGSAYLDAAGELERTELRLAGTQPLSPTGPAARTHANPAAAQDEAQAGERVVSRLRLPWDVVLGEIELAAGPSIALLAVEGQGQGLSLRLVGEAKSMADVAAYARRLRGSPAISSANLVAHEERQVGATTVLRFTLEAGWKGLR